MADAGGNTRLVLRSVALKQDGRSAVLTAPNGPWQQMVRKAALVEAGVMAQDLTHMEGHGTMTPLGDPIEVGNLQAVSAGRAASGPLMLVAVKANGGHLEGPAASTGLRELVQVLTVGRNSPAFI